MFVTFYVLNKEHNRRFESRGTQSVLTVYHQMSNVLLRTSSQTIEQVIDMVTSIHCRKTIINLPLIHTLFNNILYYSSNSGEI